jgi:hypothetical protein
VLRFRFPLLLVALGAASCGGSSSETPFPVEPDWRREAKNAGPQREVVFSGEQTEPGDDTSEEPDEGEPGEAPGTWGESESDAPRPSRRPKSEEELELELE